MSNILFTLELMHEYYSDGIFESCRVMPSQATGQLLARLQLGLVKQGAYYTLMDFVTSGRNGCVDYLVSLLDGAPLKFDLKCDAAWFFAITDLPCNCLTQVLCSTRVKASVNQGEGKYHLTPVYQTVTDARQTRIGQLLIYPQDLKPTGEKAGIFSINFPARRAAWRYVIINRGQRLLHSPRVKNDQGVEFNLPTKIALNNNEHGLCFDSGDLTFPLRQAVVSPFSLVDVGGVRSLGASISRERCVIKGLPTPSVEQMHLALRSGTLQPEFSMNVYL